MIVVVIILLVVVVVVVVFVIVVVVFVGQYIARCHDGRRSGVASRCGIRGGIIVENQ